MKKVIPNGSVLIPDNAVRAFQGMIFDVYQWPQKLYDGSEFTFEMLKRTDTVSVIGLVDGGKILVIDDEQPHLGSRRSFPGGRVDPSDASRRSCHPAGGFWKRPAITSRTGGLSKPGSRTGRSSGSSMYSWHGMSARNANRRRTWGKIETRESSDSTS